MSDLYFKVEGRMRSYSPTSRIKSFSTSHRLGVGHIDVEYVEPPPGTTPTGRVRVTVGGAVRVTVDGSVRQTVE